MIRNLASFGLAAALLVSAALVRADDMTAPLVGPASLDNPLAAHSLDELMATRERPLFARNRRPAATSTPVHVEAPPPAPPSPPKVAFYGTVVDAEGASAIIRGNPSEKIVRVRVGDAIDGWTITRIDDRRLVLSLDNQSVTFTMFKAGHAAEHAAAAGPQLVETKAAAIERPPHGHGRQ